MSTPNPTRPPKPMVALILTQPLADVLSAFISVRRGLPVPNQGVQALARLFFIAGMIAFVLWVWKPPVDPTDHRRVFVVGMLLSFVLMLLAAYYGSPRPL